MITFVFAGYDQEGRPLYTPANTEQDYKQAPALQSQAFSEKTTYTGSLPIIKKAEKAAESLFARFFLVEDGLISYSLKPLTILFGLAINFSLLRDLKRECSQGV